MPDPFAHSESDWSSEGCWGILNKLEKLWPEEDHETFSVVFDFGVLGYACVFLRHSWITKHWQRQGQEHRLLSSCCQDASSQLPSETGIVAQHHGKAALNLEDTAGLLEDPRAA